MQADVVIKKPHTALFAPGDDSGRINLECILPSHPLLLKPEGAYSATQAALSTYAKKRYLFEGLRSSIREAIMVLSLSADQLAVSPKYAELVSCRYHLS